MERRKLTGKDKVFNVFNYGVFGLLTLICAYPFYYLIINTLSANDLSAAGEILFFPKGFHLDNYKQVLKLNGIFNAAVISVARTVLGTALSVLASAFMGFMFTQERMWGRKFWYRFVVITMYFNAGMIPMFITMKNLHLTNTFWVYVIPTIVQPFNIILVKTYVESLPRSLQEAAELDGAGVLMIFWKVILPVCTPILATIAIFTAVGQWNSFQDTIDLHNRPEIIFPSVPSLPVYQPGQFSGDDSKEQWRRCPNMRPATQQTSTSIRMTVSVVVVLPILFIYPMFQKHFVKGIMMGAVKG